MRFGVLGPLDVHDGRCAVTVAAGRQRALLAVLLLHANRTVAADELVELIWDGVPPPGAAATLRAHVMRLRKSLGPSAGARVLTRYPGYLLVAAEGEVDALDFARLCRDGGAAVRAGSWAAGIAKLGDALWLWRGKPLADIPCQSLVDAELPRLEQMHLRALEARNDAVLHLGTGNDLIPELEALAREHPLHERFHAQLIRALYMSGRQAEAAAHYQLARTVLIRELGIEPGPELRGLHQSILVGDPQPAWPQPAPPLNTGAATDLPRELPAPVGNFTGRHEELAALTDLLQDRPGQLGPPVVISVIGGTAGVGKTALAVQWAHQVGGRFPDGQLYVNLHGYDRDEPVSTADALAGFLRALGLPGIDIPDEIEARARMYRSRLAGRRVLVLVDNAKDSDQVRLLLPGDRGCVAVVTSRDSLAGLVATDGARRLDLDTLPPADAVALLRSLIGGRVDDDPDAAAELAGLCAGLPLALRIAAELAAARPAAALADLVAELASAQLGGLTAGEDRADVRTVFSWSFRQLPPDTADAFALIGLHPGADLDAYAAAALTGTGAKQARQVLQQLLRASLLTASGTSRYGMHDLLRAYAREQAAAHDAGGRCRQALTGLFDYYLAGAAAAMNITAPAEAHWRPSIPPSAAAVPAMAREQDALAWLDAERANLAAVAAHCADHGWPRHATDLTATLFRYLTRGGYLAEAASIYRRILRLARTSGDLAAEADAQKSLGGINMMKGHFSEAIDNHRAALELYRRCGNRLGEARALHNLGMTEHNLHDLRSATDHYRKAIAAYKDAGDSFGAARVLVDVASAAIELNSPDEAAEHAQHALRLCRDNNDHAFEAEALERLGDLSLDLGRLRQAAEYFEQALAIHRRLRLPNGIAAQLRSLGKVRLHQGECQDAISYLLEAIEIYRATGNKHGEVKALLVLAAARHSDGQAADGRTELKTAIRLAAETGNAYQQASAHSDLAESHHRSGQIEQACHHWHQALTLYIQLGAAEADQIRARLTAVTAVKREISNVGRVGIEPTTGGL